MHVHVHTSHNRLIKSFLQIFGSSMQVMDMFNIHPVADYESGEVPFATQDVLHQPLIAMTRNTVQLIVGSHQRHGSRLHSCLKGREENFTKCTF